MSASTLEFNEGMISPVSIDYHEMMAKSLAIRQAVVAGNQFFSYLAVARDFWSLSKKFSALLGHLDQLKIAPEEELAKMLVKLQELHNGIGELVLLAKSKGLLNRSLTAPAIRAVNQKNEDFLDLIDAFEVSLNASTRSNFENAFKELQAGETVSLKSLSL